MPDEPPLSLTDDEPAQGPQPGIGLCLSGGGYRAMLFHVGALLRLNETGLLHRLNRVSSVSGGSITAGVLGMNWTQLDFQPLEGELRVAPGILVIGIVFRDQERTVRGFQPFAARPGFRPAARHRCGHGCLRLR